MTDKLQQVLDTPGCERLKDFASVGPAQRAALELFVDRVRAEIGASMTADDYKVIWEALFNMLKQFTKTPSTGADSEARIAGHKALAALEKYKPEEQA